jgi:hypothetical protein
MEGNPTWVIQTSSDARKLAEERSTSRAPAGLDLPI